MGKKQPRLSIMIFSFFSSLLTPQKPIFFEPQTSYLALTPQSRTGSIEHLSNNLVRYIPSAKLHNMSQGRFCPHFSDELSGAYEMSVKLLVSRLKSPLLYFYTQILLKACMLTLQPSLQLQATLPQPLKRCAKCQTTTYCSRECQKEDWQSHKRVCASNASSRAESDPSIPFPRPAGAHNPGFNAANAILSLSNDDYLHKLPEKDAFVN
jgi:hypothetical protein